MEREIINSIYTQWLAAKEETAAEMEAEGFPNVADNYRRCTLFRGTEDVPHLAALYTSTKGLEFCMRRHFPSIATLRLFRGEHLERYGIHLDAGNITITEPEGRLVLVGRTTAVVHCGGLRRYQVYCLKGAKAIVNATGWAVVHTEAEQGSIVVRNASAHAFFI